MNTTNIFVELLVTGLGAAVWLLLLLFAFFPIDHPWIHQVVSSPAAAVPALALTYLLGIVTDRMADRLFRILRMESKRESYEGGARQYYHDRALVVSGPEQFAQHYEYGRSRQRICRGWAVHSVLSLISLFVFIQLNPSTVKMPWALAGFLAAFLPSLAVACWLSWEALTSAELERIREQAEILRSS